MFNKVNCHNEASLFKASRGYLVRLLRFIRNDSSRGAMFGLDARIALAIFGALSVISGAALYSAIQQARVVALVTELEETAKALEAFMLDTGSMPEVTYTRYYKLKDLVTNEDDIAGWKGPYLSNELRNDESLWNRPYTSMQAIILANTAWGGTQGVDQVASTDCTATSCDLYIVQYGLEPAFADAIDEYIDGTNDRKNGNVHVSVDSGGDASVFIKKFSVLPL